jgi:hypothetical protein
MARMSHARLLGRSPRPISRPTQRVLLLLPCACCVPSLRELVPATDVAPLSPRAGPHSFLSLSIFCMADMSDIVLSTGQIEFIYASSLRRAPYPPPSDPVSRHRTRIVSSSLDPGSPAERIPSSPALCPTFDLASAQSLGPVPGQGLFSVGGGTSLCPPPHPPFGHLLPQGEKAIARKSWSGPFSPLRGRSLPSGLTEGGAQRWMQRGACGSTQRQIDNLSLCIPHS